MKSLLRNIHVYMQRVSHNRIPMPYLFIISTQSCSNRKQRVGHIDRNRNNQAIDTFIRLIKYTQYKSEKKHVWHTKKKKRESVLIFRLIEIYLHCKLVHFDRNLLERSEDDRNSVVLSVKFVNEIRIKIESWIKCKAGVNTQNKI